MRARKLDVLVWYALVARQHTDPATFLHAREVLLCLAHVRVDLIHALLDSVQLLCSHTSTHALDLPLSDNLHYVFKLLALFSLILNLAILIFLNHFI